MNVSPSEIPHSELYGILLNSVAPRPIAWVSTLSASGQPNLAPFSFFNAMCVDPPLLGFAPGLRQPKQVDVSHGEVKDTLRNIRETKEFVVNVVTCELLQPMNVTSGEYDPSVNEFELAKVTPSPSRLVRPARVAESPVSFECRLHQILDSLLPPRAAAW
jgi:flavin reductase (DIM6/NTAB) family NADH-FMN oxidoreductase RutF